MMRISAAIIACCLATPALAEEKPGLDVSAAVRLRYETIAGQARAGLPPNEDLINLRTIIRTRYRSGPVSLTFDVWDSRVFDAGRPSAVSNNEVNGLEPMQANAAIDFGSKGGISGRATIGRMVFELGSARLIANDDYRNTTSGFTGLKVDLKGPSRLSGTLLYVLPQQRLPDDADGLRQGAIRLDREGFDSRLWGGQIGQARAIGPIDVEATMLRFEERDRPDRATRDRQLTNLGARLTIAPKPARWDLDVEAIWQTGSTRTGLGATAAIVPVSAWFTHAEAGFSVASGWKPHLSAEFDYASGDDRNQSFGRFDTLFGMRRRDFSPAGLLSAIGRSNMIALGGRIEVKPSSRTDGFLSVRKMWLASATDAFSTTGVVDPTGRSGRDAGWEIDSRVRYWLVPGKLQFEGDVVWIPKGRFLQTAPNRSSTADTRYLSLNLTVLL
ncbi:alginate export family protein [Sphingomonas sp. 28-62-11]|uniref:alginate export family protein n=1 Tax=Sphingomonas sp. 28-62-11 TaxID=1970432 RepID=UPI000BD377A7|nr:MAG: hypothetical protein B7Y49_05755 [Sphingomonas sp. 28-62-11]